MNRYIFVAAEDGFFESYLEIVAKVGATLGAASLATAAATTEKVGKDVAKDVAEAAEAAHILIVEAVRVDAGVAELVVGRSFLLVREYLICFVYLFEFFYSVRALVYIRMELARQIAERLLDFVLVGVFGHSQHFVIITLGH